MSYKTNWAEPGSPVFYTPRWEVCNDTVYFIGYSLPVQSGMSHTTPIHFFTMSDLQEYVFEKYGEVYEFDYLPNELQLSLF